MTFDELTSDEKLLDNITNNIACGGSLTELAKFWGVQYIQLWSWISSDNDRLKKYNAAIEQKKEFLRSSIIDELKYICFSDLSKLYDSFGNMKPIGEWPAEIRAAVEGIDETALGRTKVKMNSKLKAIELLGKELFMFANVVEHKGHVSLEDLVSQSYTSSDEKTETIKPPDDSSPEDKGLAA